MQSNIFSKLGFFYKFRVQNIIFLLVFSLLLGFYFTISCINNSFSNQSLDGINTNDFWRTISIDFKHGIQYDGLTASKATDLFSSNKDVRSWFFTMENGLADIIFDNKPYKVKTQLYNNDAPRLLDINLFAGRFPRTHSNEILVTYNFWQKISKSKTFSDELYIYIQSDEETKQDKKFLISGVTDNSFKSMFKGDSYDVFADSKQWFNTIYDSPMFWQIMHQTKEVNIGVLLSPEVSKYSMLTRLNNNTNNLQITDGENTKTIISDGLQIGVSENKLRKDFFHFVSFLLEGLLFLALIAFTFTKIMALLRKEKEIRIRYYIGESSIGIMSHTFISNFLQVGLASIIGIVLLLALDAFDVNILSFHFKNILSHFNISTLLKILAIAFFLSLMLSFISNRLIFGNYQMIKTFGLVIASFSTLLFFILVLITVFINKDIRNKILVNNFQIHNIVQLNYTRNINNIIKPTTGNSIFNGVDIENLLRKELQNNKLVEDVLVSLVTPIEGYNFLKKEHVNEAGKLIKVKSYFANVPERYFGFFKIPIIAGNIPVDLTVNNFVIINESLARNFANNQNAIGKKLDDGKTIIAVVKDSHYLNANKTSPPFSYLIKPVNNSDSDIKVLVKSNNFTRHIGDLINRVLNRNHYQLVSQETLMDKYKLFFAYDFKRIHLLFTILLAVMLFGILSLYYSVIQWININKKNISIKIALGLSKNRLLLDIVIKTFIVLVVIGILAVVISFLTLSNVVVTSLFSLFISMAYIVISILMIVSLIYYYVIAQINEDYILKSLYR
ncbi:MAG: hypothetical protein L3J53_05055 [Proteobacteria bacterium]|nr:hypothetical protein [Pseudomonadota bacterium]